LAEITAEAPLLDADGPQNTHHTLWRVADRSTVRRIGDELDALGQLYIADGHHRSAAAARVAAERRHTGASSEASHEHFLTVAFPHDEMRILAYNRVIADLGGHTVAAL